MGGPRIATELSSVKAGTKELMAVSCQDVRWDTRVSVKESPVGTRLETGVKVEGLSPMS